MKRRNIEWVVAKLCAKYAPDLKPVWRPPRDDEAVLAELERVVHEIANRLRLECVFQDFRWENSSMVQAEYFRLEPYFRDPERPDHITGVTVVLSRLAPFYCLLETEALDNKSLRALRRGRYVGLRCPVAFPRVDVIKSAPMAALAYEIELQLKFEGYVRLKKSVLGGHLPKGVRVETLIGDWVNFVGGVWIQRRFDALFHWSD